MHQTDLPVGPQRDDRRLQCHGCGAVAAAEAIVDGKAVRTAVTVAESNDSESRISKGVAKGDSLVAAPDKDLKDGAKVEVKGSAPVAGVVTATQVAFDD